MTSTSQIFPAEVRPRIRRVQTITIAWMVVEAAASLVLAWRAHSPALLAFGGDSAIELLSAALVLWSFRDHTVQARASSKKNAARVAGGLLFLLAAFVVATSLISLAGYREPKPTLMGIAILIAAAVVMPLLAREKRKLSVATGSATLRADSVQSATCAYLSLIALVGVAANAVWHVWWADSIAALAIVPLVIREAWVAVHGRACECY